ncbi:putative C6 transcription factor [Aspergillus mulundensis]|uniref:Putative Zn(II)2Cys6 transcription factor n=1 Tax=Aspergillus mulundensis TaxID=1810919 RepID=A0A3D8T6D1_9EURO|nr:putative Zn(II)2Cys6 transcription factor [Aspergillus mulundensis]RDW94103.1 putative Zn(II)2Cys6 transcription factor [Aspergillus mulundensis]
MAPQLDLATTQPQFANPWETSPSKASDESSPSFDGRIAHTLAACTRCRQRKTKCDPGIPKCGPCDRTNAQCVYYDSARRRTIPRTYIVQLRETARRLEKELEEEEKDVQQAADAELIIRGAGRIRFREHDEARFLGSSSGIAITRLVMELAKQNTQSKSIKDVVPESIAQKIKDVFNDESGKPTSKVKPMISLIAQPNLPMKHLTYRLIDVFTVKAQAMLPTLHIPTFYQEVEEVFNGSNDPCQNFQLRMVIAISMQKMSTEYAGLADSYYLAALPFLEASLRRMDLKSLQCLVLIAQYSLLTPTRTAAYWVVGMAVKLCQDLGLTEEATITQSRTGKQLDPLEVDMRRRLFWIVTSMEFGLSHSLGRPSCYSVSHDHIHVKFFEQVDDKYITREGIHPDAKPILPKCIAIHFFKMRLLQLEIRRTLYLNKRDTPVDDHDPWFSQMLSKLNQWVESCPTHDGGSGLSGKWFNGRLHTMIIFMYRPSPQIPEPSVYAAQQCYESAVSNIFMHLDQINTGSVDLTWIFTQSLFMALNTLLWTLSYPEIRREHPLKEVEKNLEVALEGILKASDRWPGVRSAGMLYETLIAACLRAYNTEESFVVHSPSNPSSHATPASSQDVQSPPSMASPASTAASTHSHNILAGGSSVADTTSAGTFSRGPSADPSFPFPQMNTSVSIPTDSVKALQPPPWDPTVPPEATTEAQSSVGYDAPDTSLLPSSDLNFDPTTPFNSFPSVVPGLPGWDPNFSLSSITTADPMPFSSATADPMNWADAFGDQYSHYFNGDYPTNSWRGRTLSQQEQLELMDSLADHIPDVTTQLAMQTATAHYQS